MSIVDAGGNVKATYKYDPYGNVLTATGTMAEVNPIRYRGYYYDTETGLYYVSSRYYDPEIGRFINADALVSTGQGILGNNMFAYCRNNPVCRVDISGNADEEADLDDETKDELFHQPMGGGQTSTEPTIGTSSGPGAGTGGGYGTSTGTTGGTFSGVYTSGGAGTGTTTNTVGTGKAPSHGTPGSTYTQLSSDGKGTVISETTYNEYSQRGQRIDWVGRSHGVGLPHIHKYNYGYIDGVLRRTGEHTEAYLD